jgi:hypothetical protein
MAKRKEKDRIDIRCAHCGSTRVLKDAWAAWNIDTQAWELHSTMDKPNWCEKCDGETSLKEVKLK